MELRHPNYYMYTASDWLTQHVAIGDDGSSHLAIVRTRQCREVVAVELLDGDGTDVRWNSVSRRKNTYGALSDDLDSPLANISVANSSMSVDLWTGCAWQCAYCHVQGSLADLNDELQMDRVTKRRTGHTVKDVVDSLIGHPYFQPSRTVVSIGTASTEPLAPGKVIRSTFEVLHALQSSGLDNPVWIVTKRGFPRNYMPDLALVAQRSRGILLSMTWAGNNVEVEPIQNYRFLNAKIARDAGATISWHMRPLHVLLGSTPSRITKMVMSISENESGTFDSIVVGGLRRSSVIDQTMADRAGIDPGVEPTGEAKSDVAHTNLGLAVVQSAKKYFPGTPVYFKSSCAIAHMLRSDNMSGVSRFARSECSASVCPQSQRSACASSAVHRLTEHSVQQVANAFEIAIQIDHVDSSGGIRSIPPLEDLSYSERQIILNSLTSGTVLKS